MKVLKLIGAAALMAMFATGCGNNNNPSCAAGQVAVNGSCQYQANALNATSCQSSCNPGYVVTTQYGCQPQGSCSPCMASVSGSCIPSSAINTATGTNPYGTSTTGYYPYGTATTGYGAPTGYPTGYGYGATGYPTTGYGYPTSYPYGYL